MKKGRKNRLENRESWFPVREEGALSESRRHVEN